MKRKNGWTVSLLSLALTVGFTAQGMDPNIIYLPAPAAPRAAYYQYAAAGLLPIISGVGVALWYGGARYGGFSDNWERFEAMLESQTYDSAFFKALVEQGADKDYERLRHRDPLNGIRYGSEEDAIDALHTLIEAGACSGRYSNEHPYRYRALSWVISSGDLDFLNSFLNDCINLKEIPYSELDGPSPLGSAIFSFSLSDASQQETRVKVIDILLEAGAGLNDRSSYTGLRPLQEAIQSIKDLQQREKIIRMLLDAGAEVYFKDILMSIMCGNEVAYVHWNTKNLRQLKSALAYVFSGEHEIELDGQIKNTLLEIAYFVERAFASGNVEPFDYLQFALDGFLEDGIVPEFDFETRERAMRSCEKDEDYESCRDKITLRVRLDYIEDAERREAIIRMLCDSNQRAEWYF